jgi:hypothetical protein
MWTDTGASYENKSPKTAADISGKTPADAPLKTFKAHHVTRRENVESILKNGFDPRKFKPQWTNDNAVSLSRGSAKAATDYFSKRDANGKPIGMDTTKYALLEVTVRGRLQPQGSGDKVGFVSSPQAFTRALIEQGYDGQNIGQTIYVHNVGAITHIREVDPAPPKKVRGAEFNPDQPRDEHGQWSADSGGETSSVPLAPDAEYKSMDGPLWTGPVAESGLTREWDIAKYKEFETKFGFGPCGVMSVILREQRLGQIAVTYAHAPGMKSTFPHFIIIDKNGAVVDRTNPFPGLKYYGVQLLRPHEMPDLVDETPEMVPFLKSQLARGRR